MNKESGRQSHFEPLNHRCPRCGSEVSQRFYGPRRQCVDDLRRTLKGESGEVVAPEYEPKMNVTPNAVALKED